MERSLQAAHQVGRVGGAESTKQMERELVLTGIGVGLGVYASGIADRMTSGMPVYATFADLQSARSTGEAAQGIAIAFLVTAGLALAATLVMAILNVGGGAP